MYSENKIQDEKIQLEIRNFHKLNNEKFNKLKDDIQKNPNDELFLNKLFKEDEQERLTQLNDMIKQIVK